MFVHPEPPRQFSASVSHHNLFPACRRYSAHQGASATFASNRNRLRAVRTAIVGPDISPTMFPSRRAAWALVIQTFSVSASFRHGNTTYQFDLAMGRNNVLRHVAVSGAAAFI
jgi:hypothetical protein